MGNRQKQSRTAGVNWEEAHHRLRVAQAALERGWQLTSEEAQPVLRQRAKELAREPAARDEAGKSVDVVEFLVAHERYGIESRYVREVYPLKELSPLPSVPPFVRGVINFRGRIVSVVDLKRFFELPEKGLSDLNKVLIVSTERMELGILADAVAGLRRVPVGELQTSLPTLTEIRAEYLKGVSGDRLVILDAETMLADPKLVVQQIELQ
jgi:purine-binding chemotaxis protein CheW